MARNIIHIKKALYTGGRGARSVAQGGTPGIKPRMKTAYLDTFSKKILDAYKRESLELQNPTASVMYFAFDSDASELSGFTLAPGGSYEAPKGFDGALYMQGTYTNQRVIINEGI